MKRTFTAVLKKPTVSGSMRVTIPKDISRLLELGEGVEITVTVQK